MVARKALEWMGMSKAWLVFRYEISDLFLVTDKARMFGRWF